MAHCSGTFCGEGTASPRFDGLIEGRIFTQGILDSPKNHQESKEKAVLSRNMLIKLTWISTYGHCVRSASSPIRYDVDDARSKHINNMFLPKVGSLGKKNIFLSPLDLKTYRFCPNYQFVGGRLVDLSRVKVRDVHGRTIHFCFKALQAD